jgi:hypothetical protein
MSADESQDGEVIAQLPATLRQWLTLERFHLHKAESYQLLSRDPDFDTRYFPQNCGAFRLPCFLVQRKDLYVFGSQQENADGMRFFSGAERNGEVVFPIHPSALNRYREFLQKVGARDAANDGVCIWAVPTSSTRTVLAWPDGAPEKVVFIKTSLLSPIFADRRVLRLGAGRSVGLSTLVRNSSDELPAALICMPEYFAFTPRQSPHAGAIIRSIPQEIRDGRVQPVPLFSLLGGSGGRVPLLLTILERTGMSPLHFVNDVLCQPFAKLWLELSMNFGLLLEAHAQDLLLGLSPELVFQGQFYYRDFEGLQVDWELRRRFGGPAPAMPNDWAWREAYTTWGNYRHAESLWYKWHISLIDYLHFVLHETECSLREWHQRGLIGGAVCGQDEVTMIFSRHLFAAVEQMFGVSIGPPYNVYRSANRFLILLAKLRRQVLAQPSRSMSKNAGLAA